MQIRDARVEDCDQLGLITVAASLSAFIGSIPEALIDFSWAPAASAESWRSSFPQNTDRGQLFRVLEEDDGVIAFAWSAPWADTAGYDAAVRGLYVLPTAQGNGHGRRLISDAARLLRAQGAGSLEIGCVRENPSCGFYRRLGGVEIGSRPASVDRFDTVEVLFGWPDLRALF